MFIQAILLGNTSSIKPMESAIFNGVFSSSSNSKFLLSLPPSKLTWISERKRRYARRKLTSGYGVHIRSEMGHRGLDIDRRQLLLSSTLGLSALAAGKSLADPFPVPDLSNCVYPTDLPEGAQITGNCCPPNTSSTNILDFKFPKKKLPMRTRMAAHLVDDAYITKYSKAVKEMKKLPQSDPRSFAQQAKVHCAYCNGAYLGGSDSQDFAVHKTWFFAPWHRWYLYFHERILAKLIDDDTFALPFWNWDSEVGMSIPPMFTNKELSIYNEFRDPCHQPPSIINLGEITSCDDGSVTSNYSTIYTQMVSGATTAALFHGAEYKYLLSSDDDISAGTLESSPHNLVHGWTGTPKNPNREDMGTLYSAARDPIFYCHHSNVDRMWYIWNSVIGRKNYEDSDLLDSEFLFFDENKDLVRVKAGDAYDLSKLRYRYQEVDIPWLSTGRSAKKAGTLQKKPAVENFSESPNEPTALTAPVTVRVKRPTQKRSTKEKDEAEEILIVGGIQVAMAETSKFSIFLNYPEATAATGADSPHYAGTFVHLGHGKHETKTGKTTTPKTSTNKLLSYKVGITETLEDIDASEDESISVTLVPQATKYLPQIPIKFTSVKIVFGKK